MVVHDRLDQFLNCLDTGLSGRVDAQRHSSDLLTLRRSQPHALGEKKRQHRESDQLGFREKGIFQGLLQGQNSCRKFSKSAAVFVTEGRSTASIGSSSGARHALLACASVLQIADGFLFPDDDRACRHGRRVK